MNKEINGKINDTTEVENVISIIADILNIPKDVIIPESRLTEDLQADSLDITEIAMNIEVQYDCNLSDEEMNQISTVFDIINYIKKYQNGNF